MSIPNCPNWANGRDIPHHSQSIPYGASVITTTSTRPAPDQQTVASGAPARARIGAYAHAILDMQIKVHGQVHGQRCTLARCTARIKVHGHKVVARLENWVLTS